MEVTLNLNTEQLLDGLLAYLWTWAPSVYLLIAAAVSRIALGIDAKSRLRGEKIFEEPTTAGPVVGMLWPVTVPCVLAYWTLIGPIKALFLPKSLR
jgi:hypothetical protein